MSKAKIKPAKSKAELADTLEAAGRLPRKARRTFTPKTVGRREKMAFTLYVAKLFVANEGLAAAMRSGKKDGKGRNQLPLTNDQLKGVILHEYSHEENTVASFEKGNQSIEKLRQEYLKGALARSCFPDDDPGKPAIFSFRYNEEGKVVHPQSRKGDRLLTNGELRALVARFTNVRETEDQVFKRLGRNPRKRKDDSATE